MRLKDVQLFQGLSDDFIRDVEGIARVRSFERDSILFQEGDPATDIFILKKGRVELTYTLPQDPTMEIRIADLTPGDNFAWSALVMGETLSSCAHALTDVEAYTIPAGPLHELFEARAGDGLKVMKRLANQILSRLRQTRVELRWLHQGAR